MLLLKRIFLPGILVCTLSSKAQSVVNTTGATIADTGYTFEYSLGEVSISTIQLGYRSDTGKITQGLLQPTVKFVNPECDIINDELKYFENPTRNKIRIVSTYDWILRYTIYSSDGKLMTSEYFYNNQIDLSRFPAGIYFIKLYPGCNSSHKILKVIKQ